MRAEAPGAGGYAMVLHRLVAAAPAAPTADVPAVLAALQMPELGAFYPLRPRSWPPRPSWAIRPSCGPPRGRPRSWKCCSLPKAMA